MKSDSEKLDFIYNYILAQNQPVQAPPKQAHGLPFEVYPESLPPMTYLNAVKEVVRINAGIQFGHSDWAIPTREQLKMMYDNKDKIGGFITTASGSDCPVWYWSSTEDRVDSSLVHIVRFSDGYDGWNHKDNYRLSCRPIRNAK